MADQSFRLRWYQRTGRSRIISNAAALVVVSHAEYLKERVIMVLATDEVLINNKIHDIDCGITLEGSEKRESCLSHCERQSASW